jgi:acyl transferase domain-containing protein/acyl-CoA synthetase (AMP-forming)/AMP-acid ligase II/thioesterase domain-containing protein
MAIALNGVREARPAGAGTPPPGNIAGWSDEYFRRFGSSIVVLHDDRQWTAGTVHERTCRLAGGLVELGVQPGDRVLLLLQNGIEYLIAFTAVLRSGAVAVPLFSGAAVGEIARTVATCGPVAVVTTADSLARAPSALSDIRHIVIVGGSHEQRRVLDFETLTARSAPLIDPIARSADDPALICHTSGTLGSAKGVVYSHGAVHALHFGAERGVPGTVLAALPLGTTGSWVLTGRLAYRWRLVLLTSFEPRTYLKAIERHRASMLILVPSMAEALVASARQGEYDLSSVRHARIGGADVSPDLLDRLVALLPVRPSVAYGMTEAGGGIAATTPGSRRGSVGRPGPGVQVKIADEDGRELPPNQSGEVWVKTPWASAGYISDPEATAAVFRDGWVRTGDRGFLDPDSNLFLTGRLKDIIIQNGVNVNPRDVTEAVRGVPGVKECAVIGRPHAVLGEEVVACVVREVGACVTAQNIIDHCRERLDRRTVPASVYMVAALPRTATGKVSVDQLRASIDGLHQSTSDGELLRRFRRMSSAERQRALANTIQQLVARMRAGSAAGTGAPVVDIDTPFGELGLDSLQIVQLSNAISERLDRSVAATLVFNHPTIARLARHLAAEFDDASSTRKPAAVMTRASAGRGTPIAIVGAGCRLPGGADTLEAFWSLLRGGVDATREITRWNMAALYDATRSKTGRMHTHRAALLDRIDLFDAEFFELTAREAEALDPQQRLALEVTWEALENAGYPPAGLSNRSVGLFLGMSGSSYRSPDALATAPAMAVARICHFLDLHGPAAILDTSCSSSLFAVHTAVQSLRAGECDIAVTGGVQVISSPESFVGMSQMGIIAADGRCKAFSASADGYGRGEGCVMLVLKRLSDAEADRDRMVAVIRGTAARHDGRSASLTAPNGVAQQHVIHSALSDAAIAPADVEYVEAHGTGTVLGDPIEAKAVLAAIGEREQPLTIGSVKTNIGHVEAAAGAAGLLKVSLALAHAEIPPHLHCDRLNPELEPLAHAFVIPRALRPWPRRDGRRRTAGVHSMGLSGTNVHVVVEEAPSVAPLPAANEGDSLLCLSARTDHALGELAAQHLDHLRSMTAEEFPHYCFTVNAGRSHFPCRLSVVAAGPADAADQLTAHLESRHEVPLRTRAWRQARIAFLFSGHGSSYAAAGRALYESEPVFRDALRQCAAIADPHLTRPLMDAFEPEGPAGLDASPSDMSISQPALFALQWSLCQLWKAWGIEPDVVLGHSAGECTAASIAGVLSLEDGLRLVIERGRLLQRLPPAGSMASIKLSAERLARLVAPYAGEVSIAAINAPDITVVSGSRQVVQALIGKLTAEGIETRELAVPIAAHSPLVEPVLEDLERVASQLDYRPATIEIVSTLTGVTAAAEELASARYWTRHMREPVQFVAAVGSLEAHDCDVLIEIGPDAVLTALGRQCATEGASSGTWVSSLQKDRPPRHQLLTTLSELYTQGRDPVWDEVYRGREYRRVSAPTYAFQRKRYWSGTAAALRDGAAPRGPGGGERAHRAQRPPRRFQSRSVVEELQRHIGGVLGVPPATLAPDENLLARGLDSLRVLQCVTAISSGFSVSCRATDFVSNPTIAQLAAFVDQRRSMGADAHSARPAPARPSRSPLVVINPNGSQSPLFCLHPSGGQVTPYLRLRGLLGDDQPLYAIQSRGLYRHDCEHSSIEAMAIDYATIVQSAAVGPFRLLGWSMGALVANAVAAELERRGEAIDLVAMIDPVTLAGSLASTREDEMAFAVSALIHEQGSNRTVPESVAAELRTLPVSAGDYRHLLEECERRELLAAGALTPDLLGEQIELYLRHFRLVREFRPATMRAAAAVWWAHGAAGDIDWSTVALGGLTERVIGGTHFSVVRPPYIERIARDILPPAGA